MPLLRQELLGSDTLREKLFQVNFHTTLSKQGMITLLYHKQVRHLAGVDCCLQPPLIITGRQTVGQTGTQAAALECAGWLLKDSWAIITRVQHASSSVPWGLGGGLWQQ